MTRSTIENYSLYTAIISKSIKYNEYTRIIVELYISSLASKLYNNFSFQLTNWFFNSKWLLLNKIIKSIHFPLNFTNIITTKTYLFKLIDELYASYFKPQILNLIEISFWLVVVCQSDWYIILSWLKCASCLNKSQCIFREENKEWEWERSFTIF